MASRSSTVFFFSVFLLASCLVKITQATAGCRLTGHRYCGAAVSLETLNQKVVAGFKRKKLKNNEEAAASNDSNGVGWVLRKVPSGPDPLHHNGNAPKKPRTDP